MSVLSGAVRVRFVVLLAALGALALSACLTPAQPTPTPTPTRVPRPTFTSAPAATPVPATATAVSTATSTVPTIPPTPTITATPTVNPALNPLTGLSVADASVLSRRPLQFCIDNDPASRPQYGLNRADIVYEYVMERFYNTRFTAVFWGQEAERIGALRSARLVNLELAPQYDALLACQGASDPVRWLLIDDKRFFNYTYLDIDLHDPQYRYFNIYGKNARVNTNLVQTSTASVRKWLQDNGKEKTVKLPGLVFSAATPTAIAATTVSIPYPAACCGVQWTYDAKTSRYLRTMNGDPHTDGATKEQLSAANVIVVYASHEDTDIVEDTTGATAIRLVLQGEGKASVFRDGVAIAAFWKRPGLMDFMQIVDAQGKPVPLHAGNSWIEIVPDAGFTVTFK